MLEKQLEVDGEYVSEIFGNYDENIELIEETLESNIALRGNTIKIIGSKESIELTEKLIQKLVDVMKSEGKITKQSLIYAMDLVVRGEGDKMKEILNDIICIAASGKTLKPKTLGQKRYIDNIRKNDIVFGIGPAGTGKTYLAMAMAVKAFRNKEVTRIILTRPAVEAGESLGFLPGDLQEKVDPYLRPLYDALFDILGAESYLKYKERGLIEVAPLAYMRGRTLESAFIILDEAQNTTTEQMKMFLTRLGNGSKAVVTGDITQIDLPPGKSSGLKQAERILKDIKGISFSYFDKTDVVRHRLVQDIIEAYEAYDKKKSMKSKES
ncbi:PhoH family protein [Andreesenia angusta]|uniref:PhoH family protein n=1 Tax=Andreesenia angusta TaxID=39480 RepID=UPI0008D9124D